MNWSQKIFKTRGKLTPSEKLLLCALSSFADFEKGDSIFPSRQAMAERSELSRAQISRLLSSLLSKNIIIKIKDNHNIRKPCLYTLNLSLLDEWVEETATKVNKRIPLTRLTKTLENNPTMLTMSHAEDELCSPRAMTMLTMSHAEDELCSPRAMTMLTMSHDYAHHEPKPIHNLINNLASRSDVPKNSSQPVSDKIALTTNATTNFQNTILAKTASDLHADFPMTNEMQEIALAMNFHPSKIQEAYGETYDYWKTLENYPKDILLSWKGSLLRKVNHDKFYWTTSEVRSKPVAVFKKQNTPAVPIKPTIPEGTELKALHKMLGDAKYQSWFENYKIEFKRRNDELFVYCPSHYCMDWIETHFSDQIYQAWGCESVHFRLMD